MPQLRTIANGQAVDATDPEYNFKAIEDHLRINVINRDGTVAMQAPLVLSGNPTQNSHAANKAYVDNLIPPGVMMDYGAATVPPALVGVWAVCNGDPKSIADPVYARLFAVIGYSYGGSGSNFNLPNFTKRVAVGADATDPVFNVGKMGGTANNVAYHTHTTGDHTHAGAAHTHSITHDHGGFATGSDGAHAHGITGFNVEIAHRNFGGKNWYFPVQSNGGMASGGPPDFNVNATISAPAANLSSFAYSNGPKTVPYVPVPNHNTNTDGAHQHWIEIPNYAADSGPASATTTGPAGTGVTGGTGDAANVNGNYPLFTTVTKIIKL